MSFGVPVNIVNTPYKPKKLGLPGISIAPNIIKKMEQDEEYAQEIFDEINYFLFDFLPSAEQKYALQGARIKHYEMSINSNGKVVMACGGVHIDGDDEDAMIMAKRELEACKMRVADIQEKYDEVLSWTELYDRADLTARKMIVANFINRIEVGTGYEIYIDFYFELEHFGIEHDFGSDMHRETV